MESRKATAELTASTISLVGFSTPIRKRMRLTLSDPLIDASS